MKHPLLSIIGTTATGKTSLALELANQVLADGLYSGVDLIPLDSRQVYANLPILSGADVPAGFIRTMSESEYPQPLYAKPESSIFLHGVSILNADEEWSVAQFQAFALQILAVSLQKNHLPILVGGTGLYHQQLFLDDPHLLIPPNDAWRAEAATLSLVELQTKLKLMNPEKYKALNNSDLHNPRRLQRAIEISLADVPVFPEWQRDVATEYQQQFVGLSLHLEILEQRIKDRIEKRLAQGVIDECTHFLENYTDTTLAHSTLGLASLSSYIQGTTTSDQLKESWLLEELQYAKRQQVWWKKQSNILWYDAQQLEGIAE